MPASRIINALRVINRVVYDTTSRPPGAIEWQQASKRNHRLLRNRRRLCAESGHSIARAARQARLQRASRPDAVRREPLATERVREYCGDPGDHQREPAQQCTQA
jgi:hypothetical protein